MTGRRISITHNTINCDIYIKSECRSVSGRTQNTRPEALGGGGGAFSGKDIKLMHRPK